ncbi:MAG TPA: iron ABC transporter permease [Kofleriaceae bacterium]|nr:iron ABC transporter permease [Kofleriaceae bacterium]
MSGFVTGAGGRLTWPRLIVMLAACAGLTALIAVVAPLVGIVNDAGGWHLGVLGAAALDPGAPDHTILWAVRVPRVLAALLVGGALAGAGCALQALLRNPLAEPFTLGISSGASLAAVLAIRLGAESVFGFAGVGGAALAGSAATLVAVWRLARVGRQLPPATLVLAGVTLSMFCSSASVVIQATSDFTEVNHMLQWMLGSMETVRLVTVGWAALPIAGALVVLVVHARELNALAAGPEVAASLGVAVGRTQSVIFAMSALLVGAAIAVVGPIGFIGLIVPHALRAVLGADHRVLLPASVLAGASVLAIFDTLARTVIPLHHLPTGAVTAVLGVPFFVVILVSQKRRAAMWGRA